MTDGKAPLRRGFFFALAFSFPLPRRSAFTRDSTLNRWKTPHVRKSAAIAVILAVGPGTQTTAFGYGGTAAVNFAWATNSTDIGWTA